MSQTSELDTLAREIVRQHSHLALQAEPLERLPIYLTSLPAASAEPIEQTVYAACRALDFIDIDARCVASAWQRQSARTGQFDPSAWPTEPQDFGLRTLPVPEQARHCEHSDGDLARHCEHSDGDLARHCERSAAIQEPGFMDCHVTDVPRNDVPIGAFAPCPHPLGLYAVLPDAAWVGRMARAGVATVQLRFKSDDAAAIRREVRAAVQAVQGTGALLFINDHWQAAIAAGAYGVHLGQEDLDTADIKALRSAGLRLGLSTHTPAELARAFADAVAAGRAAYESVPAPVRAQAQASTPTVGMPFTHAA
jgi:thiamine-phosphate pyrophosphorylase